MSIDVKDTNERKPHDLDENGHCPECNAAALADRARDAVPQEVHDHGWQWRPVGDGAFAPPFGTIRACLDCGCLVAGGPTRCSRCVRADPPLSASVARDAVEQGEYDAEQRRVARLAREDAEDPWNILAGVRAERDALRAQVQALTEETTTLAQQRNREASEAQRARDEAFSLRTELDAALAALRDARALAWRLAALLRPVAGGNIDVQTALAFGPEGTK